jgi:hypothetical protein
MRRHIKWLVWIFALFWLLGVYLVINKPLIQGPKMLEQTYPLFSLSLTAFILLFLTGISLVNRHRQNKQNKFALRWGLSFIIYSFLFFILVFKSFGFFWADTSKPIVFFIVRSFMIIFILGIIYGFMDILTKSKKIMVPTMTLILVLCSFIFYYGLIILKDIELTMYSFLFFVFIPTLMYISYLFYSLAKSENIFSMKLLAFGFFWVGVMYMAWAPWHKNFFYFVCFSLYNLALVAILAGFLCLKFEKEKMQTNEVHSKRG